MAFRLPTRTIVGPGSLRQLSTVLGDYEAGAALVITDPGLGATELPRRVCGLVETAGFRPWVLDEVKPNPRVADVDAMAAQARGHSVQVVVAVGGGSVLDAAKGVALLLTNPGSIRDYEGRNQFRTPAAPLVAIPTTCGTGSEVTWVSVLSYTEQRRKISVKGDGLFPEWAIVDSDVLISLPADMVASTGMDAMTHAIEAYIGRASNPVSDELAISAVGLLLEHLEAAASDIQGNAIARDAVMRASTIAGMSFGNADVGPVHCLSESIGGRHDLPHGLLNAVLLLPVLDYYGEAVETRLLELGNRCGQPDLRTAIRNLVAQLGLPAFGGLGVDKHDFEAIARAAESNGSNSSAPRPMSSRDYFDLLNEVVAGA